MWFWFAIAALLCWSGSDLFSKIGSKPDDKYSHWKMVMAVGLVMGLHAAFEVFVNGVEISWQIIWAYMPASALYIASMILGYVGLRYIELSVSSPICNSSGAIAGIFCFLFLGQAMEGLQIDSSRHIKVMADVMAADVDYDTVDMIVLPGGRLGTENLGANDLVVEKCREFAAADGDSGACKYLAAICAAP